MSPRKQAEVPEREGRMRNDYDMRRIPPESFGPDHWSLLGYCAGIAQNGSGMVDTAFLRDKRGAGWKPSQGTKGRDGTILHDHDGYDCLHDLEEAGFIRIECEGFATVISMTKAGRTAAANFQEHRDHLKQQYEDNKAKGFSHEKNSSI